MRGLGAVLTVGLAFGLIQPGNALAATTYRATELGMQEPSNAAGALNSLGQVTGYFYPSGNLAGDMHAFLYSAGSGVVDLGTLGGSSSRGYAINNSGQVVGESRTSGGAAHAFTYSAAGGMVDLGTPSNIRSMAFSVNDSGQVAGSFGTRFLHAFVHTAAGGMVDLGTLGGGNSYGTAINSSGQVAGSSNISGNSATHAFVYTAGGGMVDLNTVTSGLDGYLNTALAINDRGMILAGGYRGDGSYFLYLLAPSVNGQQLAEDGLQTIGAQNQVLLGTIQNALGDINGRLFNLRSGGGEEGADGSIASSIDEGVIMGFGDGPEEGSPVVKKVRRSRQWEVFTTVNYANISLSGIGTQAGVDAQTWSPSVGIERHFSRGFAAGFAFSMLNTHQRYANNLGDLDIQGIALSAYGSYVRGAFWSDLLYSLGMLDIDSSRNPGAGFPTANGDTNATSHSVHFNTGWNLRSQDRSFVTGPFLGVDYTHVAVDAFTESGGGLAALNYGARDFNSLITRIGWSASKKFITSFGSVTPQVRLSYERQNMSNNNATSASLVNLPFTATTQAQSPGQDYVVVGSGVQIAFSESFSLMLNYQVQLFRQDMQAHFGSVRLSYQF